MKTEKPQGRPPGTIRRDIIHKILSVIKSSYSYEIWRIIQIAYEEITLTCRDVYYNVDKGIELDLWTSKHIPVKNENSWEGVTTRKVITIQKECAVEESERQMISDISRLVRLVLTRDKTLKTDFKKGRVQSFRYYFNLVQQEEAQKK